MLRVLKSAIRISRSFINNLKTKSVTYCLRSRIHSSNFADFFFIFAAMTVISAILWRLKIQRPPIFWQIETRLFLGADCYFMNPQSKNYRFWWKNSESKIRRFWEADCHPWLNYESKAGNVQFVICNGMEF